MDRCGRCEYKTTNKSNQQTNYVYMLWIDVIDVNIKLQMRVINRCTNSFIMDGFNKCEYKSINESNQQTYSFCVLQIHVTGENIKLQIRVINIHIKFICYGLI